MISWIWISVLGWRHNGSEGFRGTTMILTLWDKLQDAIEDYCNMAVRDSCQRGVLLRIYFSSSETFFSFLCNMIWSNSRKTRSGIGWGKLCLRRHGVVDSNWLCFLNCLNKVFVELWQIYSEQWQLYALFSKLISAQKCCLVDTFDALVYQNSMHLFQWIECIGGCCKVKSI